MKQPEDLLYWMGKDVKTMTRDELEAALRHACALYQNSLEDHMRQNRFWADLYRARAA